MNFVASQCIRHMLLCFHFLYNSKHIFSFHLIRIAQAPMQNNPCVRRIHRHQLRELSRHPSAETYIDTFCDAALAVPHTPAPRDAMPERQREPTPSRLPPPKPSPPTPASAISPKDVLRAAMVVSPAMPISGKDALAAAMGVSPAPC